MLAARAVQPVLFLTVMYSIAETYPGFHSPGPQIDLIAFLAQNVALDVGSFGLPKLADQAERSGNEEAAQQARKVAKALFLILVTNLVWGGIDHIAGSSIGDGWKVGIALAFTVIRAYYATEYMRVIHRLDAHDDAPLAPVQSHLSEVQAALTQQVQEAVQEVQLALTQQVQALGARINEEVQTRLSEVQGASALHGAKLRDEVQAMVQGQVQSVLVQEVQSAMHSHLSEVQASLASMMQVQATIALPQPDALHLACIDALALSDEPCTDHLPVVVAPVDGAKESVAPVGGYRQAVFSYVQSALAQGHEPTIQECMSAVGCKRRSAVEYRKEALAILNQDLNVIDSNN